MLCVRVHNEMTIPVMGFHVLTDFPMLRELSFQVYLKRIIHLLKLMECQLQCAAATAVENQIQIFRSESSHLIKRQIKKYKVVRNFYRKLYKAWLCFQVRITFKPFYPKAVYYLDFHYLRSFLHFEFRFHFLSVIINDVPLSWRSRLVCSLFPRRSKQYSSLHMINWIKWIEKLH